VRSRAKERKISRQSRTGILRFMRPSFPPTENSLAAAGRLGELRHGVLEGGGEGPHPDLFRSRTRRNKQVPRSRAFICHRRPPAREVCTALKRSLRRRPVFPPSPLLQTVFEVSKTLFQKGPFFPGYRGFYPPGKPAHPQVPGLFGPDFCLTDNTRPVIFPLVDSLVYLLS